MSPSEGFQLSYLLDGRPRVAEFRQAEVRIGRSRECEFALAVPGLSRRHAAVRRLADGWEIVDLQSRNGTFVNGRRVDRCPLTDGDRIAFAAIAPAPVELVFHRVAGSENPDTVLFDDAGASATIHMSLDVARLETRGEAPPIPDRAEGGTRSDASPVAVEDRPDAGSAMRGGERFVRASCASFFRRLGEILLRKADADATLGELLDLTLEQLGAQRGAICLCQGPCGAVAPRVVRACGWDDCRGPAISRSIAQAALSSRQAVLATDAIGDSRFRESQSIEQLRIRSAICAPLYHAGQVSGLIYLDTLDPRRRFDAEDLQILAAVGGLAAVGLEQARLEQDIARQQALHQRLARYLAPSVVEQAAARAALTDGEMLSEERHLSVLFADFCGFTTLAERLAPSEVAEWLNGAFEQLHHAIFLYEGTLDKYLGDAVMAVFGAPLEQPDHAERAVSAALRMQQLLAEFNAAHPGRPPLRMRVGINSGKAVAGDIGSPVRREYTVIGDVVNVASRLESSVAEPGQIVIGPETYHCAGQRFDCLPLEAVRLKGRQHELQPYLVVGPRGAGPPIEETVYQPHGCRSGSARS